MSESQSSIVRNYIHDQEKHHKKFDFKSEFETLLRSNGIPIDDYVWQDLIYRPQRGLACAWISLTTGSRL